SDRAVGLEDGQEALVEQVDQARLRPEARERVAHRWDRQRCRVNQPDLGHGVGILAAGFSLRWPRTRTEESGVDGAAAFEVSIASNGIVFGRGTARQVGERAKGIGARRVMLTTDKQVRGAGLLDPVEQSLREAGLEVFVFDEISTEPTFDAVHASVRFLK